MSDDIGFVIALFILYLDIIQAMILIELSNIKGGCK